MNSFAITSCRDRSIFHKSEKILTFEVLNLYPDYDYPGKIKRLQVDISGAPEEDKELVLTVELQTLEGFWMGHRKAACALQARLEPMRISTWIP